MYLHNNHSFAKLTKDKEKLIKKKKEQKEEKSNKKIEQHPKVVIMIFIFELTNNMIPFLFTL